MSRYKPKPNCFSFAPRNGVAFRLFLSLNRFSTSVLFLTAFILLSPGCGGGGSSFNGPVKGPYVPEFCGDGVIQTGEICDDGNRTSGDGCSATCQPEIYKISAGYHHTCALTTAGGVKCWGENNFGQLGDGTTNNRYEPMDVQGLTGGVVAISTGGGHACALTTAGAVKCWGKNGSGQLGDGTSTARYEPTVVTGLSSDMMAISAGDDHTCALTAAGAVKCWGSNGSGRLGDGTLTDRYEPTDVAGLTSGVAAISAGEYHTCALTSAGSVKCWGKNYGGQLGDGTSTDRYEPTDVTGLSSDVVAISSGGFHTCALTTAGSVKCWGSNYYGQLGDGTIDAKDVPTTISGLTDEATAISAGGGHTCALTTTGYVKCWGWNDYGQLGIGTTTNMNEPTVVTTLYDVTSITTGGTHTCALTTAGAIKCWGMNASGQLGNETAYIRYEPTDISGLTSGIAVASAGSSHTCALTTADGVKCWGSNASGQLGDRNVTSRYEPADVSGLTNGVTAISAGSAYTCALTATGGVKCWGYNYYGQLGDGTSDDRYEPTDVLGLTDGVAAISAGYFHTCAVTTAGAAKCWGSNSSGQLGDGTLTDRYEPTDVAGLTSGVAAISAGGYHTCALTTAGAVKCWGSNSSLQLGDGTTTERDEPVDVSGLSSGVTAVSAGYFHTCALTTTGAVKCWGNNVFGQLGDETTNYRDVPSNTNGLTGGVAAISAGTFHTCALMTAGGVKCWGYNYYGQLGDGTSDDRYEPTDVLGLTDGVAAISAGYFHTCAVTTAGAAKCWGGNGSGTLGVNPGWSPLDVVGF